MMQPVGVGAFSSALLYIVPCIGLMKFVFIAVLKKIPSLRSVICLMLGEVEISVIDVWLKFSAP